MAASLTRWWWLGKARQKTERPVSRIIGDIILWALYSRNCMPLVERQELLKCLSISPSINSAIVNWMVGGTQPSAPALINSSTQCKRHKYGHVLTDEWWNSRASIFSDRFTATCKQQALINVLMGLVNSTISGDDLAIITALQGCWQCKVHQVIKGFTGEGYPRLFHNYRRCGRRHWTLMV